LSNVRFVVNTDISSRLPETSGLPVIRPALSVVPIAAGMNDSPMSSALPSPRSVSYLDSTLRLILLVSLLSMRSIHILLLTLALSPFAATQSFDCKLAESPREHAVCSDKKLAALDSAVSVAYKSLRTQLSPESAALVQSDQREWLHWLDVVCPAHGKGIADDMNRCLADEYTHREHDLKQVVHIGSTLLFPRTHFLYKAGSSSEERVTDNDPGFGYGSLRWPQIDIQPGRPNPAYAAWNSAVKKKAAKLAVGIDPEDKNATFDTAVDASGTIDSFYIVEAANDRFIDVSLIDSGYGWGAAHPLTDQTSFLWWLDRNRELTISDVFIPQSGWQNKLAALAIRNLRSQPNLKDMLGDDIDKAVNETVSDFTTWTPTLDGLTITFGQYAIAPYAAGMPEAHIPWSDLKSYLAPDLQPTTLPAPITKPNP
jgi:uncharacterized protein YecT (DUF1311 family)